MAGPGIRIGGTVKPQAIKPIVDQAMTQKVVYLETFRRYIKRPGTEELLKYLEGTDFFIAPASTKYHGSYRAGLCAHSLEVLNWALKLAPVFFGELTENDLESIALVCLTHDYCKIDFYTTEQKWRKPAGKWESYTAYVISDLLPLGHSEKSLSIVQDFMKVSRDEKLAINWHMGGTDARASDYGGGLAFIQAKKECDLLLVLIFSDESASFISGI